MRKLKALDLFCGAGGASMGLYQAGFHVTGVDRTFQPHYPFDFIEADVFDVDPTGYDLIWASPPCQAFTAYRRRAGRVRSSPNLIPRTREFISQHAHLWVIENVAGAPLIDPLRLCGSSFGLDIRRHRFFETSQPVPDVLCDHGWQTPRFPPAGNRENLRSTVEIGVWRIPLEVQQEAMGIDWMTLKELSQAIPPAYSRYIAEALKPYLLK